MNTYTFKTSYGLTLGESIADNDIDAYLQLIDKLGYDGIADATEDGYGMSTLQVTETAL
jgi:hypothetical protein